MKRLMVLALVGALGWTGPSAAQAAAKLELVLQTGHTDKVASVSLSGDGKYALTGSWDKTAILWDVETGKQVRTFHGHTFMVAGVTLSRDGQRALTVDYDLVHGSRARLWDTATGKRLHAFKGPSGALVSAILSGDGKRVLTRSDDKTATLWEVETCKQVRTYRGLAGGALSGGLSADGKHFLCGSEDKTATLWDAQTGKQLQSFRGHTALVVCGSLSGDGKHVLTGSADRTAILWDAQTGKQLQTFKGYWSGFMSVSLSEDGKRVLTISADQMATLWDARTGKQLQSFRGHTDKITSVSLSADGKRVLTGSDDRTAILWDAQTGKPIHTLRGNTSRVTSASLNGDGKRALSGSADGTIRLWDAGPGKPARPFRRHGNKLDQFFRRVTSVSLSGDGKRALTGSWDKTAVLWDVETGQPLHTFRDPSSFVTGGSLSRDGKRVLTLAGNKVILRDAQTGKQLQSFAGHRGDIDAISLSGDGKRALTCATDQTAILWDAETGKQLQVLKVHCSGIRSVSLSGDGKRALTGPGSMVGYKTLPAILWDTETGKPIRTLRGHPYWGQSVSLSGDGKRALTGAGNDAILWDAETGKQFQTLRGHTDYLGSVGLSGDGKRAITGSADGTTRLWDAETGKDLCALVSMDADKEWLVVTRDGMFDGSVNAPRFLAYRLSGTRELVPLERFQHKFYLPGLLSLLVQGKRPRPRADLTKCLPPKVRITSPSRSGLKLESGKVEVKAVAQTRGDYPVKAFRLLLDDRPYRGQLGIRKVANPKPGESSATWTVELEPGRHRLKVMVDTEYAQGASEEVEVRYVGGGIGKVELPTLYVLAIGISAYRGNRKLDYATRDAELVAATFGKHSKPLYKAVKVKVVTDKAANRKGIFAGLQWLRDNMSQKSVGVFFFAGHGEKDPDGSLYFLPADVEEKNLAFSAIEADMLKRQLAGIPGRLMLILDACHSGAIGKGKKRGPGDAMDQWVRDVTAEENGLVVMCSALGHEQAQEDRKLRHGRFTAALIDGLAGKGGKNREGVVYLSALGAYVSARVKEDSKGEQNPVTSIPGLRDFPLSKP
jgi:WD40 repeat protein